MPGCFRLIGALDLLIVGVIGIQRPTAAPPVVTALTCQQEVDSGYRPALHFAWQTQHATAVRVESGYVDDQGTFMPGGWHIQENQPSQGEGWFLIKINNYAVRVCISAPADAAVCAVCAAE